MQKYNKNTIHAIDIVKLFADAMKTLSKVGIRIGDWEHVKMYQEYKEMQDQGEKGDYIVAVLTERYGISESTLRRIIRRLRRGVKI
jgi:hypothetical protein